MRLLWLLALVAVSPVNAQDECPPGQIAGVLESESSGRKVICHVPVRSSPAPAPRPVSKPSQAQLPPKHQPSAGTRPQQQRKMGPSIKDQCQALDRKIERLDTEARQALSGSRQDYIRTERQKARSEQYRLRCQWQ